MLNEAQRAALEAARRELYELCAKGVERSLGEVQEHYLLAGWNAAIAQQRERDAVIAWNHYMDTCRKRILPPSAVEYWCAATAIREQTP